MTEKQVASLKQKGRAGFARPCESSIYTYVGPEPLGSDGDVAGCRVSGRVQGLGPAACTAGSAHRRFGVGSSARKAVLSGRLRG